MISNKKLTDNTLVYFIQDGKIQGRLGRQYLPKGVIPFVVFRACDEGILAVEICDDGNIRTCYEMFMSDILGYLDVHEEDFKCLLIASSMVNTSDEVLEVFTLV